MPRKRRQNHKRGGTPQGDFLVRNQGRLAFARDSRAFFHPPGPAGTLIVDRLDEHHPTTGKKLGRYSPAGLEFTCPSCGYIYTVNERDLLFWHRYVSMTRTLRLSCTHCSERRPILRVYKNPEDGETWLQELAPSG
jgi:hypothetical protein